MGRVSAVVGVGLVLAVAGCSEGVDGDAAPTSESSVSVSASPSSSAQAGGSELPHSGAPAVADPLPESALPSDPCEVLTPQQVEEILGEGAAAGKRADLDGLGPGCDWSNRKTFGGFRIGFHTVNRQGLSASYANVKPQSSIFREVGPVDRFPAVAYKDSEDDPICTVVVGLADEYAISTGVALSMEKKNAGVDSCGPAERIAATVVGNLKDRAGE
ncbi:DUF3558 domain-containing protein [Saccharomonospora viridis]|uniref:DUF3558 domain-containing protein n=1 Tax=Saccharomonospora viridis (strain ATCC 15386 / DSM 43017 / JCM 3036 / CCUG 5913 / NBRC 12207 / NCIMB 9602 / P101) TaxID=471857 RepID=C7MYP7_SACVD|nr:DUF3558 domain-containing protein [Saccharomonospora viridis]ACU98136.1 hypothetical protein Svir_31630 [Saccharomonospora viridis DSM 43017]